MACTCWAMVSCLSAAGPTPWSSTMAQDDQPDFQVEGWLKTLGIESLCQWDVLVFLHDHQISLFGAEHLARLLGYASAPVVGALEFLQILRLVERSQVSQGVRLYILRFSSRVGD